MPVIMFEVWPTRQTDHIFKWMEQSKYSLLLFREAHCNIDSTVSWKSEWNGASYFSRASSNKLGAGVLIVPFIKVTKITDIYPEDY